MVCSLLLLQCVTLSCLLCAKKLILRSPSAGLGITAGYHRLWAHRAYNASMPLQYFLALGGSGAVEGSIRWWSRGHRAHHRCVAACPNLPKFATETLFLSQIHRHGARPLQRAQGFLVVPRRMDDLQRSSSTWSCGCFGPISQPGRSMAAPLVPSPHYRNGSRLPYCRSWTSMGRLERWILLCWCSEIALCPSFDLLRQLTRSLAWRYSLR